MKIRYNTGREEENAMKIKYSISIEEEKIKKQIRKETIDYRRQNKYRMNKLDIA